MSPAPAEPDAAAPTAGPVADGARRYAKTDAGRTEVRARALALTRQARNLLLIIEPGRPAADWLAMVQGCGLGELQALLDSGLVAPGQAGMPAGTAIATAAAPATPGHTAIACDAPAASVPARVPMAQALARLGYRTLYDRITVEARPLLGLIKGYRLILELERCNGPDEIRALALHFVDQVREAQGAATAQSLAERLAAPVDN